MELSMIIEKYGLKSDDILVFDLCGTLYYSNTTFDFLDFYFQNDKRYARYRWMSKKLAIKALNKFTSDFFGWDFVRVLGLKFLKGISKSIVIEHFRLFNKQILRSKKIESTHAILAAAKSANSKIILMSASLDFIVQELAGELGINEFYSTQLIDVNEVYTGAVKNDLLGAKDRIMKSIDTKGKRVVFISDNINDYKVINYVDEFIAVSRPKNLNFWKKAKGVTHIYEI